MTTLKANIAHHIEPVQNHIKMVYDYNTTRNKLHLKQLTDKLSASIIGQIVKK